MLLELLENPAGVKEVRTCFWVLWLHLIGCSMLEILAAGLVILVSWRDLTALSITQKYLLGGIVWWTIGLEQKRTKFCILRKNLTNTNSVKILCCAMGKQSLSLLDCLWIITVADLFSPGALLVPCSGVIHPWPLLPAPPSGSQTGHCHPASTNINLWLSVTASSWCCSPSQESPVWTEEKA